MGTFSDMMTLLMCFFVMLFAMSNVDEAKFDEVSQSFQQNFSIFKGWSQSNRRRVLVSNGVSQLNMLDSILTVPVKWQTVTHRILNSKKMPRVRWIPKMQELAEELGASKEEIKELQESIQNLENEIKAFEVAERIEESLAENFLSDQVDVTFDANCVVLTFNGAFYLIQVKADLKTEALPMLNKIGKILSKYADDNIEIEGHTDSVPLNGGRYENNDVLSSYRA